LKSTDKSTNRPYLRQGDWGAFFFSLPAFCIYFPPNHGPFTLYPAHSFCDCHSDTILAMERVS